MFAAEVGDVRLERLEVTHAGVVDEVVDGLEGEGDGRLGVLVMDCWHCVYILSRDEGGGGGNKSIGGWSLLPFFPP